MRGPGVERLGAGGGQGGWPGLDGAAGVHRPREEPPTGHPDSPYMARSPRRRDGAARSSGRARHHTSRQRHFTLDTRHSTLSLAATAPSSTWSAQSTRARRTGAPKASPLTDWRPPGERSGGGGGGGRPAHRPGRTHTPLLPPSSSLPPRPHSTHLRPFLSTPEAAHDPPEDQPERPARTPPPPRRRKKAWKEIPHGNRCEVRAGPFLSPPPTPPAPSCPHTHQVVLQAQARPRHSHSQQLSDQGTGTPRCAGETGKD